MFYVLISEWWGREELLPTIDPEPHRQTPRIVPGDPAGAPTALRQRNALI
jgi:hypothetical protein